MLLVVSILAASCIFDAERCVISPDKEYGVMFTVSLSGQHTRASWGEEYPSEEGVPFDFRIMPDNLRMVVLTDEGERWTGGDTTLRERRDTCCGHSGEH